MHARPFLAACASAALLTAVACTSNSTTNRRDTDQVKAAPDTLANAKATSGTAEEEARPIALNGCLQKGDGSSFILTQINEPPKGETPAQQDVKEAEHAYRLNAKQTSDDDWDKMVGHQVRVSGTLARASDVDQQVGTSGSGETKSDAKDHPKIHEGDLAQIDVADIQMTAASCGGHAMKPRRK
jgi:hypothetical protein